jgi:hypothetical protein
MRKIALLLAAMGTLTASAILPAKAEWGSSCYRWGETGYHRYDFCLGPDFIYPHERVCDREGHCWVR